MRKTKWEFMDIHLFEVSTLERHFETMANKGWMLHKLSSNYLVYERCEPQVVSFHINLFAKGSLLSPQYVGDELNRYIDLVCEYGYEQICSYSYFQVFISHQEHIIPIDTDEYLSQKAYKKATIRYEMMNYGILAIMWLAMALLGRRDFSLYSLAYPTSLFLQFEWGVFALIGLLRLSPFLRWLVQKDRYHITIQQIKRRTMIFYTCAICLVVCLLSLLFAFNTKISLIIFMICIFIPAFVIAYHVLDSILRRFIKKYHVIVTAIVLCYLMFFTMNSIFFRSISIPSPIETTQLPYSESEVMAYETTFGIQKEDQLSIYRTSNLLADIDEFHGSIEETYFSYYNITLKIAFLHDFIIDQLLDEPRTHILTTQDLHGITWYHYQNQEILVKENRVVVLQRENLTIQDIETLIEAFAL